MRTAWLAALLLVAGCGPAVGARGGDDPLDAPWLGNEATITGAHIEQLAELARADPEASAVFAEARQRLGGSFDALAKLMSICPSNVTQEGGLTLVQSEDALAGRPLQALVSLGRAPLGAQPAASSSEAALAEFIRRPHRALRRVDEPDTILVELTFWPQICFVQRLTVGEAYEANIHELVHALRYDPHDLARLAATSPDEPTFLHDLMLARGGEVEAYILSTRARLRLSGGHRMPPLAGVVDLRSVAAMQPAALADVILAPAPRGLGYADGIYRGKYAEARQNALEALVRRRDVFAKLLEDRRQNLGIAGRRRDVFLQNVEVHRHNAEVGRARGDRALEATEERGLAETQRQLAETRAILDVATSSEARLVAALAALDQQLAAFGSR